MRSAMHTWRGPTNADDALVVHTPGRWQLKTPILSRNVDQKSLETEFSVPPHWRQMAIKTTVSIDF